MRQKNPGVLPAVVVAAMVLSVGGALIRLDVKHRMAEQHSSAIQAAAAAAYSIEQRLASISAGVESLTGQLSRHGSVSEFRTPADLRESAVAQAAKLFIVPAADARERTPRLIEAAFYQQFHLQEWKDPSADLSANEQRVQWFGPMRVGSGEWIALARMPLFFTNAVAAGKFGGWVAAAVAIDDLLRSTNIDQILSPAFDYQIEFIAPNGGTRILARSTEFDLSAPVKQGIHSTHNQWTLLVAPTGGWISWSFLVSQCVLVGILGLFGGVSAYDVARRPARLRAEIEDRDRRLRVLTQRLSGEMERSEELEKQFSHASSHDAFTGLPNRSYFMDRLARTLQRSRLQPGYVLAVIVLHLERFKGISETMGVAAGDELLIQAVKRFETCLRPEDLVVARIADDEFAMLLFDIGSPQAASRAATRLQEALSEPFEIKGQNVFTTASMGISLGSSGYEDAEELLRGAHMALSKAEEEGLAHYAVFDPATREQMVTRHQMETDLHQAIERREFCLNFQPIVSLETGSISGMEVLVRWRHPLEGLIPPVRFIPLAEETGLIVPITRWVLREACLQARTWREQFPKDLEFYVSVNFSAQDLRQPDVCECVAEVLQQTELPSGVLRLEVTESFMIGNISAVSELVSRFHKMGISLLLDDFGTGYSSLSYLNRIHFDYIKIDRAFVSRVTSEAQNTGIVRAIVHLAQDMGSKTIAEGVETEQNFEQLKKLGCNYGQGYYFAKPMESDVARDFLLSRPRWKT